MFSFSLKKTHITTDSYSAAQLLIYSTTNSRHVLLGLKVVHVVLPQGAKDRQPTTERPITRQSRPEDGWSSNPLTAVLRGSLAPRNGEFATITDELVFGSTLAI